jgi:hypothetical protein
VCVYLYLGTYMNVCGWQLNTPSGIQHIFCFFLVVLAEWQKGTCQPFIRESFCKKFFFQSLCKNNNINNAINEVRND